MSEAYQYQIKTVPHRGAGEKQFGLTRIDRRQPEKKPLKSTDENCESAWNEFEAGHAALFKRYMAAVASGDSRRAALAARRYREILEE